MNYWIKKPYAAWVLLAALACLSAVPLRADTNQPQKSSSATQQKAQAAAKDRTHKASSGQYSTTHRSAKHRPPSKAALAAAARRRRAAMRPQSERIEEIQQALGKSGYLSAEPNGRWDDQTREAMRRYQADNGFPVTGLPEAKSLMKLGLGPHSLPPELDTSNAARAGTANGNTAAAPGVPSTPSTQPNSPPPATPQP